MRRGVPQLRRHRCGRLGVASSAVTFADANANPDPGSDTANADTCPEPRALANAGAGWFVRAEQGLRCQRMVQPGRLRHMVPHAQHQPVPIASLRRLSADARADADSCSDAHADANAHA